MKSKILVMTSSGPVPFERANLREEERKTLKEILMDLFPNENLFEEDVMSISYYEHKVAEKNNITVAQVRNLFGLLWRVQPGTVISILLRAIAMEMDMNYPDHISDADELYGISLATGNVCRLAEIGKSVNYRNFAAFRNIDDAMTAKCILKPLFDRQYGK